MWQTSSRTNHNWIKKIGSIDSQELLEQYILLYSAISPVQLNQDHDTVRWRWTSIGTYTVSSAYEIQFYGGIIKPIASHLWKAETEPKCRFLAWLILNNSVLTADNLASKNWPHEERCPLCYAELETTEHLFTGCNYTEAAWNELSHNVNLPGYADLSGDGGPVRWIETIWRGGTKKEKQINLGRLFTFWWCIWNERNRRNLPTPRMLHTRFSAQLMQNLNMIQLSREMDS